MKRLNAAATLVKGNVKIGLEFTRKLVSEEGKMVPAEHGMDVFFEASGQTQLGATMPILGRLGPVFERGFCLKMSFKAKEGENWGIPVLSVYTMTGEMDYYAGGGASQAEMELGRNLDEIKDKLLNLNEDKFIQLVRGIKYTKRVHLSGFLGRKAAIAMSKAQDQKHSLKAGHKEKFFSVDAYLDVVVDLGKVDAEVIKQILEFVNLFFLGESVSEKLIYGFKAVIEWSQGILSSIPSDSMGAQRDFTKIMTRLIKSDLFPSMVFHARIGGGLALGGSIGAGAKVKAAGSAHGGLLYEEEVKELIIRQIANAQIFFKKLNQQGFNADDNIITTLENRLNLQVKDD